MWSPRLKNVESKIAFGQLILRKIIKTVAIRCQILRLKCTKIQKSAGGAYSAPRPSAGLKGPTSKGSGRKGRDGREVLWSPKKILKIDHETYCRCLQLDGYVLYFCYKFCALTCKKNAVAATDSSPHLVIQS